MLALSKIGLILLRTKKAFTQKGKGLKIALFKISYFKSAATVIVGSAANFPPALLIL